MAGLVSTFLDQCKSGIIARPHVRALWNFCFILRGDGYHTNLLFLFARGLGVYKEIVPDYCQASNFARFLTMLFIVRCLVVIIEVPYNNHKRFDH